MRLRRALGVVCFMAPFAFLSCEGHSARGPVRESRSERRKQIRTVSNMWMLNAVIQLYRQDHHASPARLDQLGMPYMKTPPTTKDGWGREFYYHAIGEKFVLASFGRNGIPESLQCAPGCFSGAVLYDADIVMIDGEWAQTPFGVDR
jgi:hypothetical protein